MGEMSPFGAEKVCEGDNTERILFAAHFRRIKWRSSGFITQKILPLHGCSMSIRQAKICPAKGNMDQTFEAQLAPSTLPDKE